MVTEAATCLKQPASLGQLPSQLPCYTCAMQPPSRQATLAVPQGTSLLDSLHSNVLMYICPSINSLRILSPSDAGGGESSSYDECKGIPLTSLPSSEWEEASVEMFKVCTDRRTQGHVHAESIHTHSSSLAMQAPTNCHYRI